MGKKRRNIGKNGVLIEIVPDHLRNEVIGHLVVRDASANRICKAHISSPIGVYDAGNAQQGILPKYRRIEKIVIDSTVNYVDPPKPLRCLHHEIAILHHQICPHDDFNTHRSGKKGVLKISGVVNSRRQQDDGWLGIITWSYVAEYVQQLLAITIHRLNRMARE